MTSFIYGQKQGNIWHFGTGAGLDFNNSIPDTIYGGQTKGNPQIPGDYLNSEGTATISDSQGNMMFYSNGEKIWNKNHSVMPNGDSLMGFYSSTTAAFIIPVPDSDSLLYLFTTHGLERNLQNGLRYSMIDMCLDSGRGDIIPNQKNLPLLDSSGEKLAGCIHSNGFDYWLLAHKFNSKDFVAYHVSASGIVDTVTSSVGTIHAGNGYLTAIGQMKISPDAKRVALVFSNIIPSVAEVFDFNNSSGVVSNHVSLDADFNEYGVAFSPDNSKLYVLGLAGLYQFNLNAGSGTPSAINLSKTKIGTAACVPCGLQLGPDGKIYTGLNTVINNPNDTGSSCNLGNPPYQINGSATVYPSFIAGYEYNNGVADCNVDISGFSIIDKSDDFNVYPNPNSGNFAVKLSDSHLNSEIQIQVFSAYGKIVYAENILYQGSFHIDLPATIKNGIFFIQVKVNGMLFSRSILIKEI